jgi:hypothetical protein
MNAAPFELDPSVQSLWLPQMLPRFEFAFEMRVVTGPISRLPHVNGSDNDLLMMTIDGGDVKGPSLSGHILPGGTEWPLVRPDGVSCIDARYTFVTDDGTPIGVRNTGFRSGPPEVMARLFARQEVVDARSYYLRTWSRFDAPAGERAWLSSQVFVGIGERHPQLLFLRYYALL